MSPQKAIEQTLRKEYDKQKIPIEEQLVMLKQILGPDYKIEDHGKSILENFITCDSRLLKVKEQILKLRDKQINVLLVGETGTGKEILAQSLNENRKGKFIGVNCAGIPESLFESEFFGVVKGAYTGCNNTRDGYFEQANNGTIFLDEISELPYYIQCKLLRVIESRVVRRIGDTEDHTINCRIVSATNCLDLHKQITTFRQDLYYRLRGTLVTTIPLRERRDDIRLIVDHYDKEDKIPVEFIEFLVNSKEEYPFLGNVRELKNMIQEYLDLNT